MQLVVTEGLLYLYRSVCLHFFPIAASFLSLSLALVAEFSGVPLFLPHSDTKQALQRRAFCWHLHRHKNQTYILGDTTTIVLSGLAWRLGIPTSTTMAA